MQRTYISAIKTGGQGKTTTAQVLHYLCEARNMQPRVASADTVDVDDISKIGRLIPGTTELGTGLRLNRLKQINDKNVAFKYWDKFGGLLLDGGYIIDVGANVINYLFEWSELRNSGSILRGQNVMPIDLVVTVKAETQGLIDALALLRMSLEYQNFLPFERRFVVMNEVEGVFTPYQQSTEYNDLLMLKTKGVRFLNMERCESELWPYMERNFVSISRALAMEPEQIESQFGLNPFEARAGKTELEDWASSTTQNFMQADILSTGGGVPEEDPANLGPTSPTLVRTESEDQQPKEFDGGTEPSPFDGSERLG